VYRAPGIRQPIRTPIPQQATNNSTMMRGVRPMIRPPPGAMVSASPQITFSARPTLSSPGVVTGLPVPAQQPGFVPVTGLGMPIMAPPPSSIPLPPEQTPSDPKPSTSSSSVDANDADKNKNKKKKDKKPRKLVRSAGGTVWEDQSLQDWDPSKKLLFKTLHNI